MNTVKLYQNYLKKREKAYLTFDELIKARTDTTVKSAQGRYTIAARERELAWTAYVVAQTSETEESHRKAQG